MVFENGSVDYDLGAARKLVSWFANQKYGLKRPKKKDLVYILSRIETTRFELKSFRGMNLAEINSYYYNEVKPQIETDYTNNPRCR